MASPTWDDAVRWLLSEESMRGLAKGGYYDEPRLAAAERFWQSAEWQAVRELLSGRNGRALDVGAGHGIATYALSKDGWETVALEPNPGDLAGAGAIRALAKEANLHVEVVCRPAEDVPFADCSFDLVFGRAVFHHARDLQVFARELIRVLKPGGLLVATREHVISNRRQLRKFLERHPLHIRYGGENAYRVREYVGAIEKGGGRVIKILRPLESPINYAPHDREGLRRELSLRAGRYAGPLLAQVLRKESFYSLCLKMLMLVDLRPGRAFTFVAEKPR